MPDPDWIATGAGNPDANGDYSWAPEYSWLNNRKAYKNAAGIYLVWHSGLIAWSLQTGFPTGDLLYYGKTSDSRYDLPANPWSTAASGQDPPPTFSAYEPPPPPPRPSASLLLTEGQPDPTGLLDPTPALSWTYLPSEAELPQDAYHIRVATSQALLDAGNPDIWDSGIIESAATEVIYPGDPLADLEMYFWAVRVRDTNGIWSEDW